MPNSSSSSNKTHSKKSSSARDRDKNKAVPSESGGSSQCDTPPLTEKDGGPSQGRFAGIGPDSVQCVAEQVGAELTAEAATNLAEDASYKLRQMIFTIALHSGMMKKSRVESVDVNSALMLADTSPVIGACTTQYTTLGEDKLCCPVDTLLNIADCALVPQTYVFSTLPTVSVEWITDEKSLNNNSNISVHLQNYYTKVARAILNLVKKPKELAVADLMTNTRIGPIFPNLFNLAVLVLNDDNLNALNVPAKKPLQSNVLDMVDALCSNPCSLDTNIQQQFQRLFPVMVSNILGNGSLADKMVAILTKITRTWPSFIAIGKGILFDYLSQGTKERLTAPMIKCVLALGRQALVECLGEHLDHLDDCIQASLNRKRLHTDLREAILDASTCLLRSEPKTKLEDFVMTDYTLYEMLGDSLLPRRTLFAEQTSKSKWKSYCRCDRHRDGDEVKPKRQSSAKKDEEYSSYVPIRPVIRLSKVRIVPVINKPYIKIPKDALFEPTKFKLDRRIHIKIKGCRSKDNLVMPGRRNDQYCDITQPTVAASGFLHRFKYRLSERKAFPIFGSYVL